MWSGIAALVIVVLLVFLLWRKRRPVKNLPPGPGGLPMIGSALSLDWKRMENTFEKWRKEHGDIFMVHVGPETMVVLCNPELIREAFNMTVTTSRMSSPILKVVYADNGIIFSSGELWHQTRRFTLFHLRNFGMGKSLLEDAIQEQINGFLNEVIAPCEEQTMSIDQTLNIAVVNIIWQIVSGEKFGITDTRILDVMNNLQQLNRSSVNFMLLVALPFLYKLPNKLTGIEKTLTVFEGLLDDLLRPAIARHKETFRPGEEPRDYIDCFLQQQHEDPNTFTDRHLLRTIVDLFLAGSETTSTTLRWAFCLLCRYQDVQRRIQAEVDEVVGGSRPPTQADRGNMPYTEAFLMELQRTADLAPIGLQHVAADEFQLAGYTIPRGAQVISFLRAVHQNPQFFPEPSEFRPERFLDDNGKVRPNKALIPFSVGKRSCLGEPMARAELFLFVTSLLQKYSFRFPDGFQHDLSLNETRGFTREPKPFQLVPEKRNAATE